MAHATSSSRRLFASELCTLAAPRSREAQGRPGAGCTHGPPAEKNAGGSHHRYEPDIRPPLRDGSTVAPWSPRCAGLSGHRCLRSALALCRRGIGIGMPGPHDLAVRLGAVRRHDRSRRSPRRPPHPAPDVRDGRELSLVWDGMWRDKHKFGKKERRIFLSRGLDRANQVDAVREFGFSAQADFADFGAWQAGELVPTELPSGLACWLCENLRI